MTRRAHSQRGHIFQRRGAQHFCCRVPVDILFRGSSSRRGQSQRSVFNPSTQGSMPAANPQRCSLLHPCSTRTCTSERSCASRSRKPTASPSTSGASASPSTTLPPAASPSSPSGDLAGTRRSCRYRVQLLRGEVGPGGLQDNPAAAWCVPAAP